MRSGRGRFVQGPLCIDASQKVTSSSFPVSFHLRPVRLSMVGQGCIARKGNFASCWPRHRLVLVPMEDEICWQDDVTLRAGAPEKLARIPGVGRVRVAFNPQMCKGGGWPMDRLMSPPVCQAGSLIRQLVKPPATEGFLAGQKDDDYAWIA